MRYIISELPLVPKIRAVKVEQTKKPSILVVYSGGQLKWDGKNIWPLITGHEIDPKSRDIYWNFKAESGFAIRSGDWKLISSETDDPDNRTLELFNMEKDPYETEDLADQNVSKVSELVTKIEAQFSKDYLDVRPDLENYAETLG